MKAAATKTVGVRPIFSGRSSRSRVVGLATIWVSCLCGPVHGQTTSWTGGPTGPIYYTGGNVGIGTASPRTTLDVSGTVYTGALLAAYHSNLGGTNGFALGAPPKATSYAAGQGMILIGSNDAGTPLQGFISLVGDSTGSNRRLSLGAIEQGVAWRNITLAESAGNVGIGTTSPQYKLAVNGTIGTKEVIVTNAGWSDYVFKANYHLKPLAEVAAYIRENHHLPDIPSESEVKAKGVSLGDMQAKLLAKVEELTLHMIQESQRNDRLEEQNRELHRQIREQNRVIEEGIGRVEALGNSWAVSPSGKEAKQ